jgi:hypothetical protein
MKLPTISFMKFQSLWEIFIYVMFHTLYAYEIFTNEIFIYEISDVWNSAYENYFNSNFVMKNM